MILLYGLSDGKIILSIQFHKGKIYIMFRKMRRFKQEISRSGGRVCCLELEVEHMTGKFVNES